LLYWGDARLPGGTFSQWGPSHGFSAIPFLKGLLPKLPAYLQKIRLQTDSGFFSLDFLIFLVQRGIAIPNIFTVKFCFNQVVESRSLLTHPRHAISFHTQFDRTNPNFLEKD